MVLAYERSGSIATLTVNGRHSAQEVHALLSRLAEDPRAIAPLQALIDVQGFGTSPDLDEVRRAAGLLADLRPRVGRHHALVVDNLPHFELATLLSKYAKAQGFEVGVFWTVGRAREWLEGCSTA